MPLPTNSIDTNGKFVRNTTNQNRIAAANASAAAATGADQNQNPNQAAPVEEKSTSCCTYWFYSLCFGCKPKVHAAEPWVLYSSASVHYLISTSELFTFLFFSFVSFASPFSPWPSDFRGVSGEESEVFEWLSGLCPIAYLTFTSEKKVSPAYRAPRVFLISGENGQKKKVQQTYCHSFVFTRVSPSSRFPPVEPLFPVLRAFLADSAVSSLPKSKSLQFCCFNYGGKRHLEHYRKLFQYPDRILIQEASIMACSPNFHEISSIEEQTPHPYSLCGGMYVRG